MYTKKLFRPVVVIITSITLILGFSTAFGSTPNDGYIYFIDSGQSLGSSPTFGVALGDLDNDGDLDAFTVNNNNKPNKVWINDGIGVFTDSDQYLGASNSQAVALGDLNGDGYLDAFVANWFTPGANKVWLNHGVTQPGVFYDSGQNLGTSMSRGVALGDLDLDGDLDAFIGNTTGQPNKVWLNNGEGIFTDSGQNLGGSNSHKVALDDLNGDGYLDAFVANYINQPNEVWLNHGDTQPGFFYLSQNPGSSDSHGVALGDLDGDGDSDAFIANTASQPNYVWLNDGTGWFTDSGQRLANNGSTDVELGDLDNDGDLDAFVTNYEYHPNKVWINDETGAFTDSGQELGNFWDYGVSLGDLDGDNDIDAFIAIETEGNRVWLNTNIPLGWMAFVSTRDGNGEIYRMDSNGKFFENVTQLTYYSGNDGSPSVSPDGSKIAFNRGVGTSDFNQLRVMDASQGELYNPSILLDQDSRIVYARWSPDGKQIVYIRGGTYNSELYKILLEDIGSGEPVLEPIRLTYNLSSDQWPDWSHDGNKIIVAETLNDYEIDCGQSYIKLLDLETNEQEFIVDLNDDPILGCQLRWSPVENKILFKRVEGSPGSNQARSLVTIEVIKDEQGIYRGVNEQVLKNGNFLFGGWSYEGSLVFYTDLSSSCFYAMSSDGTGQPFKISVDPCKDIGGDWWGMANSPPELDVDNELVAVDEGQTAFNNGTVSAPNPSFTKHFIHDNYETRHVYAIDLDKDGDTDVVSASGSSDSVDWWENDGSENFTEHTIKSGFTDSTWVFATDMDNDSDIDVMASSFTLGTILWWENDGNQNFLQHTVTSSFGGVQQPYAYDIDGDSDMDVVAAALWADAVAWWENDGNENFTYHYVDSFGGGFAVDAIDLDQDGDVDLLAAGVEIDQFAWWENDGSENFTKHVIASGRDGKSIYAFDMDKDNDIDVMGGICANGGLYWYENDGSENFSEHLINDESSCIQHSHYADLENDGDIDVIGAAMFENSIDLYLNDGGQTFSRYTLYNQITGPQSVFAIDLDGDFDVDVLSGSPVNNDIAWWENFSDQITIGASVGALTNNGSGTWSWSWETDDGPVQSQIVTVFAEDSNGASAQIEFDLIVNNVAPTATFNAPISVNEGDDINISLTSPFDPSSVDNSAGFEYAFDCGEGLGYSAFGTNISAVCPTDDNGVRTLKGKIRDKDGGETEYTAVVTVNNVAPSLGPISAPLDPIQVGTPISASSSFTDPGTADTHSAEWSWGDGNITTMQNVTSPISADYTYTEPGVYTIELTVTDDDDGSDTERFEYVVVYNPEGGFVTGGGWIWSPAGAYTPDPTVEGKANFGFVSKYKKGSSVPTGNTEFQFKAGDLNFHSSDYEWLVVTGSDYAMFKGTGAINGEGVYKFMIWAGDSDTDTFRIKIWQEVGGVEDVYYDNGMDQPIDGGNIVVHSN